MPGVPGAGGPPPKRSNQRRRVNKPEIPIDHLPSKAARPPAADADWHPVARQWYDSLADSGQSEFYAQSDWATAYLLAECISRDLSPVVVGVSLETGGAMLARQPMKGANLAAYLRGMTALMVTEGDRRRLRIELARSTPQPTAHPEVPNLSDYRDRLG